MNYMDKYMDEKDGCHFHELTEIDCFPPEDDRLYSSGIDDIEGGDNFADYAEWFWEVYEEEIYDAL